MLGMTRKGDAGFSESGGGVFPAAASSASRVCARENVTHLAGAALAHRGGVARPASTLRPWMRRFCSAFGGLRRTRRR
jgi:hypothetical protein